MQEPKIEDIISNPKKYNSLYCKTHLPEFYNHIITLPGSKFVEKLWRYFYGEPRGCVVCGKPTKFIGFNSGYRDYCSNLCSNRSDKVKQNKKISYIKHFGVDNPMKCKHIADKLSTPRSQEFICKIQQIKKLNRITNIDKLVGYTENGDWICKCPNPECNKKCSTYITTGQIERDRIRLGYETCTILNPIGSHGPISIISRIFFNKLNQYLSGECEKQIGPYKVDWYDPDSNTVIEFNGDYWHANPKLYSPDWIHPTINKSAKEIWKKDKIRVDYLKSLGYKVIVVWESEADINKILEDLGVNLD